MRTTVTIDGDVERLLREAMRQGRKTFKQVLNDALRKGLRGVGGVAEPPFQIDARPLELRPGIDTARLHDVDAELEIDEFREKTDLLSRRLR